MATANPQPTDLQTAKDAIELVRSTREKLIAKRDELRAKIEQLKARNELLLNKPVPYDYIKSFIFEVIDKGAMQYAEAADVKGAIASFAFPTLPGEVNLSGRRADPLSLKHIEAVRSSQSADEVRGAIGDAPANLFHGIRSIAFDHHSRFYFFFGEQIKAVISQHFDQLFPADAYVADDGGETIVQRLTEIGENRQLIPMLGSELSAVEVQLASLKL